MEQWLPSSGIIKNILCPIEFSGCATAALRYAADIARCQTARLTVIHADRFSTPAYFTLSQIEQLTEMAKQWRIGVQNSLEEFVRTAVGAEFPEIDCCVVENDPHEAILKTADAIHADLIVMGTHGRCGMNRFLLGSVAEEVLRMARIPLLAVRTTLSRVEIPARHVLCPVNDSPEARRTLDLATLVAGCFGASVTVLHVRKSGQSGPITELHSWISDAQRARCRIDEVTREGDEAQETVMAASESNCDLVVIGARRHRFLEGTVLGTATERVVRHSPCPVMVVPLEGNETPGTA